MRSAKRQPGQRNVRAVLLAQGERLPTWQVRCGPCSRGQERQGKRLVLAAEKGSGFLHSFHNGYAEGTARFAGMAADALGRGMLQCLIMGTHRGRYLRLHGRKVIEFVDHGDI